MEEQACLVRARSDSESSSKLSFGSIARVDNDERRPGAESGAGEPGNVVNMAAVVQDNADGNESGELLDYNDSSVLEQFHEDALRQAGCGWSQARIILAVSLAVAGASLELSSIPFILPSAEIELCIFPHEKNWLVMISLVGGSLGAVGWGALAERLGRRRTLLSCLAVNAVFASIAAFMPTYGTFMMARFCSAIGSGGVVPAGYAYVGECAPRSRRSPACAPLLAAAALGTLTATLLARAVLPHTGAEALIENKEHFSAWHRYLLLCTLPILASLISLIWTPESPRYLLDVGREVDAMVVYQGIHSSNQLRVCSKANVAAGDGEYRLGELALPGKRRPPALHHVRHSVKMFWQAFFQLFSNTYRNTTLRLGATLVFSMAIQYYLSAYIPNTVARMEGEAFEASKRTVRNQAIEGALYNDTLSNVEYVDVAFRDCTFRDMFLAHVTFRNCSFERVAFCNLQTSMTAFQSSIFVNSTIIDTDIELGRELDAACVLRGTSIRGMRGACARHADLTAHLGGTRRALAYSAAAALLAAPAALLPAAARPAVVPCVFCILLSPALYLAESETMLYIIEAAYRAFISIVFFNVCVGILDSYPANLRCTTLGTVLSAAVAASAIARGVAGDSSIAAAIICGVAACIAAVAAPRR
ncbi:synaptic vesicle glycoprotein 2C-like [Epargyreus clarus]|uniref:synaptic vesicle glycoprotein 2C-like n=1 Tax=Epargyreus clarus TaxID=520877 RepID=UPI003C2AC8E5